MESIIKVALMLLTDRRSGESGATRIGAGALYSGFAVITLGAGLACALAALWLFLSPRIGSAGAALAVAGVLLITSGFLMMIARSMFQSDDDDDEERPALAEELLGTLGESFADNKLLALAAAVVAGLVAGSASKK